MLILPFVNIQVSLVEIGDIFGLRKRGRKEGHEEPKIAGKPADTEDCGETHKLENKTVTCVVCDTTYAVDVDLVGEWARCLACGTVGVVSKARPADGGEVLKLVPAKE